MHVSRRNFLVTTTAAGVSAIVRLEGQPASTPRKVFRHGVASGDPLSDRVILWTRVAAPPDAVPEVAWIIARDAAFRRIVSRGTTRTAAAHDFTIKVDASGLDPATTYY